MWQTRHYLMGHTLNDVLIRACTEEPGHADAPPASDGLEALRAEATFYEAEEARLREALAAHLSALAASLAASNGTHASPLAASSALLGRAQGTAATPPPGVSVAHLVGLSAHGASLPQPHK